MTLGTKIQELRKEQSLSQEAFAEIIGVTRQSVSKWELDQSCPAIDKLVEIADFFHISLDDLLRAETLKCGIPDPVQDSKSVHASEGRLIQSQDKKLWFWYFLWLCMMVIIIMILFGLKAYTTGFIFSQILVWLNVIVMLYKFLKQKVKSEK